MQMNKYACHYHGYGRQKYSMSVFKLPEMRYYITIF